MTVTLPGPYETHDAAEPIEWRQRYYHRIDLNIFDRFLFGPGPAELESSPFNVEGGGWIDLTWEMTNRFVGLALVRDPALRIYDIDGVTLLAQHYPNFTFTPAFGVGTSTGFRNNVYIEQFPQTQEHGRVWRIVSFVWDLPVIDQATFNAYARVRHGRLLP